MSDGLRPTNQPKPTQTITQGQQLNYIAIKPSQSLPSPPSTVAQVESAVGRIQKLWVRVLLEELHFSWKRFQNTIDFVIKVGLWLRLGTQFL